MEFLKKYPKTFQWLFLLIVFFALCFAIEVPETYKFIRGQAEFVKDPNQSSYVFLGKEVRYYAFDVFWRLPPLLGWLPIWINDSLFFLMNEWMPIEVWNEDTQEFKSRPIVLQISRNLTAFMTFLIELIREILLGGLETIVAFTSWDWIDKNPWAHGFLSIQSQLVKATIVSRPPNKISLINSMRKVMKAVKFLLICKTIGRLLNS